MEEKSLLDTMLSKGIKQTLDEFKQEYANYVKETIYRMVESKDDPKIILKKIVEFLEKERIDSIYAKHGW